MRTVGAWLRGVRWVVGSAAAAGGVVMVCGDAMFARVSPAPRATVAGHVALPPLPPADARPSPGDLGMPRGRDAAERRRSVVYLEEGLRGAFEELPGSRARINQVNEQFVPRVLAVTTGTTVDFPNSDRIYHNVFSLSKARTFDLGRYAAGRSRSVRFDRPGLVRVFCDIHSHMSAWVLVFNHPFFAVTDDDGRYWISNVPPGSYSLAAWHETLPLERRRIDVPGSGTVRVDFAMRR